MTSLTQESQTSLTQESHRVKTREFNPDSNKNLKKGSLVALFALGLLALTIIGSPLFIYYVSTHTFTDLTKSDKDTKASNCAAKVNEVAGNVLSKSQLKTVKKYVKKTFGKELNNKEKVIKQRLRKKNHKLPFSITPIAYKGKISGYLIHGDRIGSKSTFSKVKKGTQIWPLEDGLWAKSDVCMHLGSKKSAYKPNRYYEEIQSLETYLGEVKHPNVEALPSAYGWVSNNREFMVHELRAGDAANVPATSSQHLLEIFRDIVSGLKYYHDKGILHRDIKLENVLIDTKGRAILADSMPVREKANFVIDGTFGYIPPENFTVEGEGQSRKSDMYAVGATILDLKTTYLIGCIENSDADKDDKSSLIERVKTELRKTRDVFDSVKKLKLLSYYESHLHYAIKHKKRTEQQENQKKILVDINKHQGLKDESLDLVEQRLAYLDQIARRLVSEKADERLNVDEVLELLEDQKIAQPDLSVLQTKELEQEKPVIGGETPLERLHNMRKLMNEHGAARGA